MLLPKLNPLILDGSNGVRAQLLRLFRALPPKETEPHIGQMLLYIRAGLTHLAADIRSSATEILSWALETCPNELVSCAGGWVKTLKCLLTVLHWHDSTPKSAGPGGARASTWTSSRAANLGSTGSAGKLPVKTLNVLAAFLRAGLNSISNEDDNITFQSKWPFPLHHVECHMLPKRSNAFAHLNLFGPSRDEEGEMYVEREERQKNLHKMFRTAIDLGVEAARREGGEVGRAAAGVGKAIEEGMEEFEPDS